MLLIAPSLLSADFGIIKDELNELEAAGADWLHLDIMDGHFVPNITFGPDQVKSIAKYTHLPLDVHLMIENPNEYIEKFAESKPYIITLHHESKGDIIECLKTIRNFGIKSGISIKPDTDIYSIEKYLDYIDMVLIMSVYPGFGGQKYLSESTKRVSAAKEIIGNRNIYLQVDGGINAETAKIAACAGADVLVAGSYVFKGDKKKNINSLRI